MKTFLKKGLVMMCVPVLFMGCAAQNTTEGKETFTSHFDKPKQIKEVVLKCGKRVKIII